MDSKNSPTTELLNILSKAMNAKEYGSIEIYLEEGQITQISQRVIKKIIRSKVVKEAKKKPIERSKSANKEVTLKFQN